MDNRCADEENKQEQLGTMKDKEINGRAQAGEE